MSDQHSQTNFLNAGFRADSPEDAGRLATAVAEEVRKIVGADLRGRPEEWKHIDARDVVQEVFARLLATTARADGPAGYWNDRKHFYRVAGRVVRNLRVEHASRRKKMHQDSYSSLPDAGQPEAAADLAQAERMLRLDAALRELEKNDPRAAQAVELHHFGVRVPAEAGPAPKPGPLTLEEIAELLGVETRGAAHKILTRGLRALRKSLGTTEEDRL